MQLQNDICNVEIWIDYTYTLESMDNKPYNIVINPQNLKRNDIYRVFSIQIDLFDKIINIALIGSLYSYDFDCAVLDGEILTVLQDNAIIQINIKDGSMIFYKQFDCLGCNYGIYKIKQGYIIYGELEITMLDFDFNKKWKFSGKDIFVSISEKKAFELCDNSIKLYDFENNFYEIDLNGKLIYSKS